MPRVVVLGTGTGVGKTYVTALLTRALSKRSAALALKPVETGVQRMRTTDAATLAAESNAGCPTRHALYEFPAPVSPHLAARFEGMRISIARIANWVVARAHDMTLHDVALWTLVETAGGALSPLSKGKTNLDLAVALDPAIWILVAPDALGVLHDVQAALIAFRALARPPDFVVLSAARGRDPSTGTNAAELGRLGIIRPAACFGRDRSPAQIETLVDALSRHPLARPRSR